MILQEGKIVAFIFMIISFIVTIYYASIKKGKIVPPKLAAVDAITEGVDRAVEMGKPVHYTGGERCDMTGVNTPMTVAMLTGLMYVAGLCAEKGARLIVSAPMTAESIPIMQRIVHDTYALKGKVEKYDVRDIRYYGDLYTAGVLETFAIDGCACNIMIGASAADSLVIQDNAKRHGALNIGGTARWVMQYSFATLADYMLIGPEIYAASAVMSMDPAQIRTIASEDVLKVVSLAILVVGSLLALAGSNIIESFLKF